MSEGSKSDVVGKVIDKAYPDIQPAVQQAAQTVTFMLEQADLMVRKTVSGIKNVPKLYAPCRDYFLNFIESIPPEEWVEPKASIAFNVIQTIPAADESAAIQEMFAKLLASACDKRFASSVHPAFVSIIKEMSPVDAQIFRGIAHLGDDEMFDERQLSKEPDAQDVLIPLSNLERLGLIHAVSRVINAYPGRQRTASSVFQLTTFGAAFIRCCIAQPRA